MRWLGLAGWMGRTDMMHWGQLTHGGQCLVVTILTSWIDGFCDRHCAKNSLCNHPNNPWSWSISLYRWQKRGTLAQDHTTGQCRRWNLSQVRGNSVSWPVPTTEKHKGHRSPANGLSPYLAHDSADLKKPQAEGLRYNSGLILKIMNKRRIIRNSGETKRVKWPQGKLAQRAKLPEYLSLLWCLRSHL